MRQGCWLVVRASLFAVCWAVVPASLQAEEYLSQDAFLKATFGKVTPKVATLWLQTEHKSVAKRILGHDYQGLRIRYWQDKAKTAWILNEIGKERPIRIGVVVGAPEKKAKEVLKKGVLYKDTVTRVSILAFEESRGWEVRYPFFTEQFDGVKLTESHRLDKNIDGITGATLSVRAVTNTTRLALYLHRVALASVSSKQAGL